MMDDSINKKEIILVNQACCTKCFDSPKSTKVHEIVFCKCGNIAVDGGNSYLRRLCIDSSNKSFKETSLIFYPSLPLQNVDSIPFALY